MLESVLGALGASSFGPSTCESVLGASETLGVSLRSTRGPTSGWGLALESLVLIGGLFFGGALVGLMVSVVVLSLTGLLCAVLKLSELLAVEGGGTFTTGEEVESAAGGLFSV